MRLPIKLNASRIPRAVRGFLSCQASTEASIGLEEMPADVEESRAWFSARVSALQSAGTWKNTWPNRHPLTAQLIAGLVADGETTILEVGISDGVTSIGPIADLDNRFLRCYATDRVTRVCYEREGRRTLLRSEWRLYMCHYSGACDLSTPYRLFLHASRGQTVSEANRS